MTSLNREVEGAQRLSGQLGVRVRVYIRPAFNEQLGDLELPVACGTHQRGEADQARIVPFQTTARFVPTRIEVALRLDIALHDVRIA
jgi:hypothetical protein